MNSLQSIVFRPEGLIRGGNVRIAPYIDTMCITIALVSFRACTFTCSSRTFSMLPGYPRCKSSHDVTSVTKSPPLQ